MVNAESVRAWVTIYLTDRLLGIAFDGSVKKAATTCESLAGLEYAEVANELLLAAEPFETSIAKAAKFLVGSNWESIIKVPHADAEALTVTHNGRKLRCKSRQHFESILAAHKTFAVLNSRVDAVLTEDILTEEELRKWMSKAFDNIDDLIHLCIQSREALLRVAQKRLNAAIVRSENTLVEIPGNMLGSKLTLKTESDAPLSICDAEGTELIKVAANTAITIDAKWGYVFTVRGAIQHVEFAD